MKWERDLGFNFSMMNIDDNLLTYDGVQPEQVVDSTAASGTTPSDTSQQKQTITATENASDEPSILPFAKTIEAGVHIGLSVNRWNPRMSPYVFQKKRKYCVFNTSKVLSCLRLAFDFLKQVASNNGQILVDTRNRRVQKWVRENCADIPNVHYVAQRWLGGTLTNLKTIHNSIDKLNSLTNLQKSDDFKKYTKKEQIAINKTVEKMIKFFGGIMNMNGLPDVLIVDDAVSGKNAISEANKLGIPVVALANTNANPQLINYIIPCNTHSPRSVVLILSALLDAIKITRGEPAKVAFKKDEEVELFFFPKSEFSRRVVNHRSGQRRHR